MIGSDSAAAIFGLHRQSLDSLFENTGDLFLAYGDLTGCENIISGFSHCSLRPVSCSADVPCLRLSSQLLRPSKGDAGLIQPLGQTKRCQAKAPLSASTRAWMLSSMPIRRRCTV